jgi:CheY-like chemotaxis protein/HPt (histidine-containing phosphotransfer) domain-containing protein
LRRPSLLIVEDNEINQKLAARMVEKLGYRASIVSNGREAIEALAKADYDAILMDCQMPVLDGFETTRIIRQREADAGTAADATAGGTHKAAASHPEHIPIIAVTANAMKGDREQCLAAGMDDYLAKPIQLETLRSVLERWVPVPILPSDRIGRRATANHVDADMFDLAALEANLGSDHQLIRQLVVLFVEQHRARLAEIKAGLETGDATTVERVAHTLKGAAGNLRAGKVASAAGRIEELVRQGCLDDATAAYPRLESEVLRLVRILDRHRQEYDTLPRVA